VQSWNAIVAGWLDPESNWRLAPKPKQRVPRRGHDSRSIEDLNCIPLRVPYDAAGDLLVNPVDIKGDIEGPPMPTRQQGALNRLIWINVRLAVCIRKVTAVHAPLLGMPMRSPLHPREAVL
jgi:hypothetical protein